MNLLFYVCLCILSYQLSQTNGMTLRSLEKRGWTLNSAGYLLGPYAHKTLTLHHGGTVGKRDSTESILPTHQPSYNESYLHALMEFFMYLRMKDHESVEDLMNSKFSDEMT